MKRHALQDIVDMLDAQKDALGVARANFLSKKAEKRNLEARLRKAAEGASQAAREMHADATDEWLQFEKELNRLEAIYDFQRDKFEVLKLEYQAQYQEHKENGQLVRRQGA